MSTNNKNNNKNSVNTFHDFMPYWSNEEACYKDATIEVDTTTKEGNTIVQTASYPRIKPVQQMVYENYMATIKNPTNNEFYPQRTKEGIPIEQPNNQPNAKYCIKSITRFRKSTGEEYLYSQGEIQGFNSLGSPVSLSINAPETWSKTIFDSERKFNPKSNSIEDITKGVRQVQTVYELPFSKENVNRLYSMAVSPTNKMHNNRYYNVSLVLKEEQSGIAMEVKWSSLEKSLELFRDKDFLYLWHTEYIPDTLKRELREKSEALTDNKPIEVPTLEKPDNKNYKGYTL